VLDAPRPWRVRVVLAPGCLAQRGVVCRTCGEFCDEGAIRFRLQVGGCAIPEFDLHRCTGCGACVAPCPVAAIRVPNRPVTVLREAGA
jgi:ferredoxin-type protein NapF